MTKRLAALSLSLLLCGATAIAILAPTASAQAPDPRNPVMLAQATPPAAAARAGNGRALNRPMPTAAERTARREAMCQGGTARAAGRFASLEVRLNLTGAQTAAFGRWRDVRLAAAKSRAAECAARPLPPMGAQNGPRGGRNGTPPSPVERLTREETMLQHRLSDIQAERPALEALYTGLSATQRRILAREHGGGFGPRHGMGGPRGRMGMVMGMRGGPGGNGNMMFRRGPMNGGMRGPQGSGRMPPPGNQPPPSQYPQ